MYGSPMRAATDATTTAQAPAHNQTEPAPGKDGP
jgi:hypothetical protein